MIASDAGIGISPQEQTKIFEHFYRIGKTRSIQSGSKQGAVRAFPKKCPSARPLVWAAAKTLKPLRAGAEKFMLLHFL